MYSAESKILVVDVFDTAGPGKVFDYFTLCAPKLYCCIGSERIKSGTSVISKRDSSEPSDFHNGNLFFLSFPQVFGVVAEVAASPTPQNQQISLLCRKEAQKASFKVSCSTGMTLKILI